MAGEENKAILLIVEQIQKKLTESPVLNGGWDVMLARVESLDEGQKEVLKELDALKETIYDPDTGVFARLGEMKHGHQTANRDVDEKLGELIQWKQSEEKRAKEVNDAVKVVEELKKWKASITRFMWIVIIPAMGSIFAKIAYDLIAAHIQLK